MKWPMVSLDVFASPDRLGTGGFGRWGLVGAAVVLGAVLGCQPAPEKPADSGPFGGSRAELSGTAEPSGPQLPEPIAAPAPVPSAGRPRLLDLGAGKCIPCKMMAPILDELKQQYADVFDVEFIDVWKDSSAADKYQIRLIPTQIFFDASGKELFRHEGFFSKEDILNTWKRLGIDVDKDS